jgi:hypothetical protein
MVMRQNDRILVLEKIDPKSKDNTLIDSRVFTGENQLHAVMDTNNCMWTLRYEHGTIPPALRMKFTDFKSMLKIVEDYFKNKNIKIVKVVD